MTDPRPDEHPRPADAPGGLFAPSPRRTLALYALGAMVGLGLAGFALFTAKGTTVKRFPPEDVALVNGRHILRSDFINQAQVEAGTPFAQTTAAQRRKTLEAMIDEELKVQRGMDVDLAASDPDVRAAMVAGVDLQVDAEVVAGKPSEAELRAYYDKHVERYSSEGVMRLRDLVTPIGADTIEAARARASADAAAVRAAGPTDAVLAAHQLKDSGAIDRDDNFNFGVKARLGDELYAQALKLKPGEVSAPVQRPDGLHIVYMVAKRDAVPMTYVQAADRVWQDLKKEERDRVEGANLKYLRGKAEIVVAPEFRR